MNVITLIPILLVVVVIFVCLRKIRVAVSGPTRNQGPARCGKCSYEIADLSFDRCPECGGRLLEVGIVTPALIVRRGSSVTGLIVTWTVVIVLFAFITFGAVGMFWSVSNANLPRGSNAKLNQTNNYMPARNDQSQDYRLSVVLDVVTNASAAIRSGTIDLELTRSDQSGSSLKLDAVTLEVVSAEGSNAPSPGRVLTIDDVLVLYESAGLDVDDARITYEADQLLKITSEVSAIPFAPPVPTGRINLNATQGLRRTGGGSSSSSAPPAAVVAGLNRTHLLFLFGGGFWLIVYVIGLKLMLIGRPRALESSTEPTAT